MDVEDSYSILSTSLFENVQIKELKGKKSTQWVFNKYMLIQ